MADEIFDEMREGRGLRATPEYGGTWEMMQVPRLAVEALLDAFDGPPHLVRELPVIRRTHVMLNATDVNPKIDPLTALAQALQDHVATNTGGEDGNQER